MLKKLFAPAKIGKMELKNRLVVSPMVCNFCNENGEATERFIAYHTEKAKGGWGLILTENYAITPDARGFSNMACMYEDEQIASHSKLTKSVHKHGAKIVAQMVHAGRQTDKSVNTGVQVVAPSAIPCPAKQEMPHELTTDEIKRLVSAFGDTARRFKEAGFDGVEIHGGHGYLIAEFMSSYANKRVDEYGGALINRMRFVKEIIDDVRKKTGPDFPVLFRISSEEQMPGGRTIQDTMAIAVLLEEWGIDAIDITCGTYGEDSTIPSMAVSHAWNIDSAARVKSVVSIPVMAVGRINEPVLAEAMLRSDKADFIIMGRGSLADPELPVKAETGRLEMIRQCIGCLQGCIGRLQTVGAIACLVNPQLGFEYISIDKAPKPLNVAIAGGGPAGIEAARGAAMRGHSVTLYEKNDRLGGNFQIAAYPPYKGELSSYVAWAGRELAERRVKILYNAKFTASIAKHEKYDAVVIATGAELSTPKGVLISGEKALDARELIYGGKAEAGQNVAVIGGGLVGLEAAVHLGWLGRNVTIFEMRGEIASDVESGVLPALLALVKRYNLTVLTNATVKSVEGGSVKASINGIDEEYVFDTVALAFGLKPIDRLAEELKDIVPEIIVAGDARVPAKAVEAVRTGFVAGSSI